MGFDDLLTAIQVEAEDLNLKIDVKVINVVIDRSQEVVL